MYPKCIHTHVKDLKRIKFCSLDEILSIDFITLCTGCGREIARQFAICRIHCETMIHNIMILQTIEGSHFALMNINVILDTFVQAINSCLDPEGIQLFHSDIVLLR